MIWKKVFKLMNNEVFGQTTESVRKDRDIEFVTTEVRTSYLASEPNCHFPKLEKLESPGEKTGNFSLLDQANNNFLEKKTCKL